MNFLIALQSPQLNVSIFCLHIDKPVLPGSRVRFHYGHPDVFDRLFHITRGGISKASRGINLSEDIFAGIILYTSLPLIK